MSVRVGVSLSYPVDDPRWLVVVHSVTLHWNSFTRCSLSITKWEEQSAFFEWRYYSYFCQSGANVLHANPVTSSPINVAWCEHTHSMAGKGKCSLMSSWYFLQQNVQSCNLYPRGWTLTFKVATHRTDHWQWQTCQCHRVWMDCNLGQTTDRPASAIEYDYYECTAI